MANILKYEFKSLNVSVAVEDVAYASRLANGLSGSNNPNAGTLNTKPHVLGQVVGVNHDTNHVWIDTTLSGGVGPSSIYTVKKDTVMVMFQKNPKINTSGVLGYYVEVEYKNKSTLPAEMFATAVDYTESSK